MFRAALFSSLLLLTGCIDVDMMFDFTGSNAGTATAEMRMSRETFDMFGQSPEAMCEDGVPSLSDTEFLCVVTSSGTIDEIVSGEGEFEMEEGMTIERVGSDQVRVTVDLAVLTKDAAGAGDDAEMREMLVGHNFVFRVRGAEIVETTGDVSDDGTTALVSIPLVDLVDPATAPKDAFVTLVQLP